jgi:hypothetical protein
MSKKKKSEVMVSKFLRDAVNARLDDQESLKSLPTLLECLLPVHEGGKLVRAPGKLTIQAEGAHWRIKLDCPTGVLTTTVAVESLVTCLDRLEEVLTNGQAVWSPGWTRNKKLPTIDDPIQ